MFSIEVINCYNPENRHKRSETWDAENNPEGRWRKFTYEDQSRTRKEHGPENLSAIRKTALNLLKLFPSKDSIKVKRKKLGWNQKYLKQALKYIIDL